MLNLRQQIIKYRDIEILWLKVEQVFIMQNMMNLTTE
jgi:hypothetical protein